VYRIKELAAWKRRQYLVYLGLCLGVGGLTAIVGYSDSAAFQRFIGRINPLLAFVCVAFLGLVLSSIVLSRGWFAIYRPGNVNGLLRSSGIAALFGLAIILVDLIIVFPADMNVSFPDSLPFYPAVGFLVEILFHVLPLSLLLILLSAVFRHTSHRRVMWICIAMVSLIEPIYQAIDMASANRYPPWAVAYVFLHVFLINLFQLFIFARYDFVSMYAFRLVYYMFWHIGWGYLRLDLLF